MIDELKAAVCEANRALVPEGLVRLTWGNVSGIDRSEGLWCIKPSGVAYEALTPDDMVVLDLAGQVVEGKWRPSSDTKTHLHLYQSFYCTICKTLHHRCPVKNTFRYYNQTENL
jgi:L-ribulose-5-phosphate 4-epimerase